MTSNMSSQSSPTGASSSLHKSSKNTSPDLNSALFMQISQNALEKIQAKYRPEYLARAATSGSAIVGSQAQINKATTAKNTINIPATIRTEEAPTPTEDSLNAPPWALPREASARVELSPTAVTNATKPSLASPGKVLGNRNPLKSVDFQRATKHVTLSTVIGDEYGSKNLEFHQPTEKTTSNAMPVDKSQSNNAHIRILTDEAIPTTKLTEKVETKKIEILQVTRTRTPLTILGEKPHSKNIIIKRSTREMKSGYVPPHMRVHDTRGAEIKEEVTINSPSKGKTRADDEPVVLKKEAISEYIPPHLRLHKAMNTDAKTKISGDKANHTKQKVVHTPDLPKKEMNSAYVPPLLQLRDAMIPDSKAVVTFDDPSQIKEYVSADTVVARKDTKSQYIPPHLRLQHTGSANRNGSSKTKDSKNYETNASVTKTNTLSKKVSDAKSEDPMNQESTKACVEVRRTHSEDYLGHEQVVTARETKSGYAPPHLQLHDAPDAKIGAETNIDNEIKESAIKKRSEASIAEVSNRQAAEITIRDFASARPSKASIAARATGNQTSDPLAKELRNAAEAITTLDDLSESIKSSSYKTGVATKEMVSRYVPPHLRLYDTLSAIVRANANLTDPKEIHSHGHLNTLASRAVKVEASEVQAYNIEGEDCIRRQPANGVERKSGAGQKSTEIKAAEIKTPKFKARESEDKHNISKIPVHSAKGSEIQKPKGPLKAAPKPHAACLKEGLGTSATTMTTSRGLSHEKGSFKLPNRPGPFAKLSDEHEAALEEERKERQNTWLESQLPPHLQGIPRPIYITEKLRRAQRGGKTAREAFTYVKPSIITPFMAEFAGVVYENQYFEERTLGYPPLRSLAHEVGKSKFEGMELAFGEPQIASDPSACSMHSGNSSIEDTKLCKESPVHKIFDPDNWRKLPQRQQTPWRYFTKVEDETKKPLTAVEELKGAGFLYESGKMIPVTLEWESRDAFDYQTLHAIRRYETWLDDRVKEALEQPYRFDTSHEDFSTGALPASGTRHHYQEYPLDADMPRRIIHYGPIPWHQYEQKPPEDPWSHVEFRRVQTSKSLMAQFGSDFAKAAEVRIKEEAEAKATRAAARAAAKAAPPKLLRAERIRKSKPYNPFTPKEPFYIRPVEAKDFTQIVTIYNYYVINTVHAVERAPVTTAKVEEWFKNCQDVHLPFFVAVMMPPKGTPAPVARVKRNHFTIKPPKQHQKPHALVLDVETVFGFVVVFNFAESKTMWEHVAQINLFVEINHRRLGVAKNLLDRTIGCMDIRNTCRKGVPFQPHLEVEWHPESTKETRKIVAYVFYQTGEKGEEEFRWKKAYLENFWEFDHVGTSMNFGDKFGQGVHVAQFVRETYKESLESHWYPGNRNRTHGLVNDFDATLGGRPSGPFSALASPENTSNSVHQRPEGRQNGLTFLGGQDKNHYDDVLMGGGRETLNIPQRRK